MQLNGEDLVFKWLVGHSTEEIEAMYDFLPRMAADPAGVSSAERDEAHLPTYPALIPGTNAFVDYVVIEQFRTVQILRVSDLRLDDL